MFCRDFASWGPRRCLGDKFSLLEQRTLLLKLLCLNYIQHCNTCMSLKHSSRTVADTAAGVCYFENVLGMLLATASARLLTQFQAWREVWSCTPMATAPSIGLTRWRHGDAGGYILEICNQLDAPAARGQALVTTVIDCWHLLLCVVWLVGTCWVLLWHLEVSNLWLDSCGYRKL